MSASLSALCLFFAGPRSEQTRLLRHHGGVFPMLGAAAGILSYIAMQFIYITKEAARRRRGTVRQAYEPIPGST